jgi:hypothetical protein
MFKQFPLVAIFPKYMFRLWIVHCSFKLLFQGRIQDFELGEGAHLKKLRRTEGRENFGGISCEKSRFYANKFIFFPILGGGGHAPGTPPPLDPPLYFSFWPNVNRRKGQLAATLLMYIYIVIRI